MKSIFFKIKTFSHYVVCCIVLKHLFGRLFGSWFSPKTDPAFGPGLQEELHRNLALQFNAIECRKTKTTVNVAATGDCERELSTRLDLACVEPPTIARKPLAANATVGDTVFAWLYLHGFAVTRSRGPLLCFYTFFKRAREIGANYHRIRGHGRLPIILSPCRSALNLSVSV